MMKSAEFTWQVEGTETDTLESTVGHGKRIHDRMRLECEGARTIKDHGDLKCRIGSARTIKDLDDLTSRIARTEKELQRRKDEEDWWMLESAESEDIKRATHWHRDRVTDIIENQKLNPFSQWPEISDMRSQIELLTRTGISTTHEARMARQKYERACELASMTPIKYKHDHWVLELSPEEKLHCWQLKHLSTSPRSSFGPVNFEVKEIS